MSTTIDERVVEMRFDNKQFESNVATSMSTLEKLKQKLNLSGASKGLEDVNAAAKRVDMSPLGNAVESIKVKFSALDVVAVTALANITNSAVNAGKRLVSSLSVDQVKEGWKKFSDKTTSVATLVAQGNAIEDVNKQLDRLNWFTDETSYNFTDMVSNIAKFTATGKGLDESVTAMEGIATWAALSGQNAATASRAMYQLSQAMGAGVMRLEDYKSIQNASMDTEEFRQKCIDAAIELGTLKEVSEGTYQSLLATGKGAESFNISQFTTKLTDGAWMTSEVMMKVFNDYSAAVNGIYEAAEEKGMLASEVIDEIYETAEKGGISTDEAIQKLGYSFDSFALKAFEAAQKARTFNDAIDSVKDAVSTGWMNTFELVFGDAEQATKLWTDVANQLYDVFAAGGERRNEILESAMTSKWDTLIERVKEAGVETDKFEQKITECAKAGGVDVDKITDKYGSLSEAFKQGAIDVKYLKEAVDIFNGTVSETEKTVETIKGLSVDFTDIFPGKYGETTVAWGSDAVESVKKVQTALTELGYALPEHGIDGRYYAETWRAVADFQKDAGLAVTGIVDQATIDAMVKAGESLERVAEATGEVGEASAKSKIEVDDLVDGIDKMSGQELVFNIIHNTLEGILGILGAFRGAWAEVFPTDRVASGLHKFLEVVHSVSEAFILSENNAKKLQSTFKGVIAIFDILTSIVGGALKAAFEIIGAVFKAFDGDILMITGNIGDVIAAFRDWIVENEIISIVFGKVVDGAKAVINVVKSWIRAFTEIPAVSKFLFEIKRKFTQFVLSAKDMDGAMKRLQKRFEEFKNSDFAQNILAKIQAAFKSISDYIPKAIKALGEWFEAFKQTAGVQKLIDAVNSLIDAFKELFSGEIDASEFATKLGDGLGRALASLPAIAGQLASDFIAGFTNGLGDGISGVISTVVEFCSNFVAAFAAALGIHSPSVIAHEDGVNFIQGFINGLTEMIGVALEVLKKIGAKIVEFFKSLWEKASAIIGKIDWKKVFAGAMLVGAIWFLKKIGDFFGSLTDLMDSIGGVFKSFSKVLDGFTGVLKSFSKVLNGIAWDFKAKALLKMAIAIGILVAAVWALTQIDDIGKLWNAVGVIAAVALILVGLSLAMNKLSSASLSIDKNGLNLDGLKTTILQIGIAIALIAFAVKMLGGMDQKTAEDGFKRLAAIVGGMIVFMAILGGITRYSGDLSSIAPMMVKMAVAIGLMALVCKLIGTLSVGEMLKGAAFVAGFTIFIKYLVKATKLGEKESIAKLSGLLMSVSLAMILMIGVCKLASKLNVKEILAGAAFMAGFVFFIKYLVKATKLGEKESIAKLSGLLMSVSIAMMLMIGVCKLAASLSLKEILVGAAFIAGFTIFIKYLVKATTITNAQQIAKVSATILAMSVAIAILAAVCVALSFLDIASLAKGIGAITILSVMMALMVKSLKGAQNAKGAIMMMAIAIGVMAGAVYLLSRLDTAKMLTSAGALAAVMAAFALMVSTLKKLDVKQALKGALGLLALMVPIAAFVGILHLMTGIDGLATKTIVLTGAMAAMVGLLFVLQIIGKSALKALKGALGLLALMVPLIGFVHILRSMGDVGDFKEKIIALCAAMGAMTILLGVLTLVGLGGPAAMIGIASLIALMFVLSGFVDILSNLKDISNAEQSITALIKAMSAMTILLGVLTLVGLGGPAAIIGVGSLIALVAAFGVIGAMIDGFISSFGESLMNNFIKMAEKLSECMEPLAEASEKASKIDAKSFEGVGEVLKVLTEIGKTSVKTSFSDWLNGIFDSKNRSSITKFGDDGVAFFDSMKRIGDSVSGVNLNTYAMNTVLKFAQELIKLRSSLPEITTFGEWITSDENSRILENFGKDCAKFIGSMKEAFDALKDDKGNNISLNSWAMTSIITAAEGLAGIQTELRTAVSKIQTFDGYTAQLVQDTSLGTFGENCELFIESMATAFDRLKTEEGTNIVLNTTAMDQIITVGGKLSELQARLVEPLGNIQEFNEYSYELVKDASLTQFGVRCQYFISSMATAFDKLKTEDGTNIILNTAAMDQIITAGGKLADLQARLVEPLSQIEQFNKYSYELVKDVSLTQFGVRCQYFVSSMLTAFSKLKGAEGADVVLNTNGMDTIITYGNSLADLEIRLRESVGKIDSFGAYLTAVFAENKNLTNFGVNCKAFVGSMTEAFSSLSGEDGEGVSLNTTAMDQIITAGTKLAELEGSLTPMKSVLGFFNGTNQQNLEDFGDNIALFAGAMTKFSEAGTDFSTENCDKLVTGATSIATLAESCKDLNFDGLNDLTGDGSISGGAIGKIASAMNSFNSSVSEIDTEKVTTTVTAALKLRTLIMSLSNFTGKGIENFNPEEIGEKIQSYSEKISGVDVAQVVRSTAAGVGLKNLISDLSGLDSSGAESFKPVPIGSAIKEYSNKVSGIDLAAITNSITGGHKIRSFINSLSELNNDGVSLFKPVSIGEAIKSYSNKVSGINLAAISNSITAGNKIRSFINSLSGFKTSGISSFRSAVSELGQINFSGLSDKMTEYNKSMKSSGQTLANSLNAGMQAGINSMLPTVATAINKVVSRIRSRNSAFRSAGAQLAQSMTSGFASNSGGLSSAASSAASSGVSSARGYWSSFFGAGEYLAKGFANGISLYSYVAEQAARSMAASAASAAKAELKQHSPSRVFMEIGRYSVEGFAIGLESLGSRVEDSATTMADKAINTTRGAMTAVLDTLNSDIDSQPTIRPVVDLSDVRTGADAISGMFGGIQTVGVRSNLNAISTAMNDKLQNGSNSDVVSAINKLNAGLENARGDTYNFGGFTYDDGSNVSDAVETLIRYARIGRRR